MKSGDSLKIQQMHAKQSLLSQSSLKELLDYDHDTGALRWKIRKSSTVQAGDVAGKIRKGYVVISIDCREYLGHRLAWLYVYGKWPSGDLDHINHVRDDNRIENLRIADHAMNSKNNKMHVNNTSGVMGVRWREKQQRWNVNITSCGKQMFLGSFVDFFEACCARKSAENKHGYHPNHGKPLARIAASENEVEN